MEFPDYFDIIIVAIVIILALKGLFSGFIREVCSTIGIVGGVLVASRYNIEFGAWINSFIKLQSTTLLNLIGFMIILALIWIAALVLAEVIVRFAKFIKLGQADRFLGVFVAGIKIFLVLSIILFTFSKMNFLSNFTAKLQDSSFCYPVMIKVGNFIVKTDFVSDVKEKTTQSINDGLQEMQETLQNNQ
ncbi:hypothetical protein CCY99_03695 [Helicobacter sp. 16-1353]|uniref:CvpA family protein n=1 Tax=Helicobacter sp. 16-1353 TaxID=2004996 RepID=UPI000DCE27D3|nr:CvpA family protein [Helicobacter sp. 16-1353]RAX54463.1 hypothetical protein CCY99_03695 [Helicobacter sp. 16-1353]